MAFCLKYQMMVSLTKEDQYQFKGGPFQKPIHDILRGGHLKVSRSRNKIVERNFAQKTNERICFSILTTRKYLKLEF